MRTKRLIMIFVLVALTLPAPSAHAGGMVTVCDEAHLLAALADGGTVTFACSGTITLTNTITIAADTTIDGSGQDITISGNNTVRVFYVNPEVALNLNKLAVANGTSTSSGGGIYNNGGTLIVSNSTFSGNSASTYGGGAIINYGGTLTVSNSTFIGNSATTYGGGVHNDIGTLNLSNSTFSSNSASQGGGLYNDSGSTMTLMNTIIANSSTGNNCSGVIIDGGGNLSYPDTTCPGINADPILGLLRDNGGPTSTVALGPGSAALDAGDDAICEAYPVDNLDQRGVARPQGANCDIGALEQLRVWLPIMLAQG